MIIVVPCAILVVLLFIGVVLQRINVQMRVQNEILLQIFAVLPQEETARRG